MNNLSKRVKQYKEENNCRIKDLSFFMNISTDSVERILLGKSLGPKTIKACAKILGITIMEALDLYYEDN